MEYKRPTEAEALASLARAIVAEYRPRLQALVRAAMVAGMSSCPEVAEAGRAMERWGLAALEQLDKGGRT